MRIACEYCGVEKYKQPATLKKNRHNFCNRECYHRYQKEFWEYPTKEKKQSFFQRLKESLGGERSEKNQRIQTKRVQRQTKNPNREDS